MKKSVLIFLVVFFIFGYLTTFAQNVGINSDGSVPNSSAMLDVSSTTKGLLIPRMTQSQRDLIPTSASTTGLLIYQTNNTPGFYFYNSSSWTPINNLVIREVADEFTATISQTAFTLTQTPSANSKVKMYINGIRISNTAYSNSSTVLTYVPANNGSYSLVAGDRIQFDYYY